MTTLLVLMLIFYSWPIWFLGAIFAASADWRLAEFREAPQQRVSPAVWLVAASAAVMWLLPLPWTQAEQRLRRQVEAHLRSGRIGEGPILMSAHQRSDFPPHWDPPPRIAFLETTPNIVDLMAHLERFRSTIGCEKSLPRSSITRCEVALDSACGTNWNPRTSSGELRSSSRSRNETK